MEDQQDQPDQPAQQQAPPQVSPDGAWWWDGQRWQPMPKSSDRMSGQRLPTLVLVVLGVILVLLPIFGYSMYQEQQRQSELGETGRDAHCRLFPENC